MANHSFVKLPFAIPARAMAFLAKQVVGTAFGGFYKAQFEPKTATHEAGPDDEEGGFFFLFEGHGSDKLRINLWSDGPRDIESRHSTHGIDRLCQDFLESQLACCFGARHIDNDGLSPPGEPGRLRLFHRRMHDDGRRDLFGEAKRGSHEGDAGSWLLYGASLEEARKLCPKLFEFEAPKDVSFEHQRYALRFLPEEVKPLMIAHEKADTIDIRASLDWGAGIEAEFGSSLDKELASALLMPAAAMGLAIPEALVIAAGANGCSRGIAMAIIHRQHKAAAELLDACEAHFGAQGRASALKSAFADAKKIARQAEPEELPLEYWPVGESLSLFEQAQLASAVPSAPSAKKSKSARI